MRSWYSMRAGDGAGEILVYDEIGGWGITAKQFALDLKALGAVDDLTVRINSPGGSSFDGVAIYNALARHPAHKTVWVDGFAASAASVVAMAGDEIVMPGNTIMMIHEPYGGAVGTAADMRAMADALDRARRAIVGIYAAKTERAADEIEALLAAETWMSAREAFDLGFGDRVADPVAIAAKFDIARFNAKRVPDTVAALLKEVTMSDPAPEPDTPAAPARKPEAVEVPPAADDEPKAPAEPPDCDPGAADDAPAAAPDRIAAARTVALAYAREVKQTVADLCSGINDVLDAARQELGPNVFQEIAAWALSPFKPLQEVLGLLRAVRQYFRPPGSVSTGDPMVDDLLASQGVGVPAYTTGGGFGGEPAKMRSPVARPTDITPHGSGPGGWPTSGKGGEGTKPPFVDFAGNAITPTEDELYFSAHPPKPRPAGGLEEFMGVAASSAFEDAIAGGKGFSEVLEGLATDIERLLTRKFATEPLMKLLDTGITAGGNALTQWWTGYSSHTVSADWTNLQGLKAAHGGVFESGNVVPFARGGLIERPTLFPMARGMGLMGEAGPEAVLPLRRTRSSDLGVAASGGAGVTVNVINNAGAQVKTEQKRDPRGGLTIDVMIDAVEQAMASRAARPGTTLNRALAQAANPIRAR